jgi:hypothetical protein
MFLLSCILSSLADSIVKIQNDDVGVYAFRLHDIDMIDVVHVVSPLPISNECIILSMWIFLEQQRIISPTTDSHSS